MKFYVCLLGSAVEVNCPSDFLIEVFEQAGIPVFYESSNNAVVCRFTVQKAVVPYESGAEVFLHRGLSGRLWWHDYTCHVISSEKIMYSISQRQDEVKIFAEDIDASRFTEEVVRVARAILVASAQAEGWRLVHAAALFVESLQKTVLLVGPPGSGKTSLLLEILSVAPEQMTFISNDKVLFDPIRNRIAGLPYAVGVRAEISDHYIGRMSAALIRRVGNKRYVWPRDLAKAYGFKIAVEACDPVVVAAQWRKGVPIQVKPIPQEEAAQATDSIFEFTNRVDPMWITRIIRDGFADVFENGHLNSSKRFGPRMGLYVSSALHGSPSVMTADTKEGGLSVALVSAIKKAVTLG